MHILLFIGGGILLIDGIFNIVKVLSGQQIAPNSFRSIIGAFLCFSVAIYFFKGSSVEKICLSCQKVFYTKKGYSENQCPYCGGKIEPLKGFYERHPELRNEK